MEDRSIHANEELHTSVLETVARLRGAGVDVDEGENPAELARLLDAVEEFEAAVKARGGDLMVDEAPFGGQPQPDDGRFVVPLRRADETLAGYRARILDAAARLER